MVSTAAPMSVTTKLELASPLRTIDSRSWCQRASSSSWIEPSSGWVSDLFQTSSHSDQRASRVLVGRYSAM